MLVRYLKINVFIFNNFFEFKLVEFCSSRRISNSQFSRVILSRSLLPQKQYLRSIRCCSHEQSTDDEKEKELERIAIQASIDDPPTSCCMSGCANCVYIVWAEALSTKMQNAGPEIAKKILEKVEDPSMRAYLEMELRMRLKK